MNQNNANFDFKMDTQNQTGSNFPNSNHNFVINEPPSTSIPNIPKNIYPKQNNNFNFDQFGIQANNSLNSVNPGTLSGNSKPSNFNFASNNNFNFDISKLDNSKKDGNNFDFKF
jgi:hypothetical protein